MAMLTMRAIRFLNKTGRKINANGSETIGFNKSQVECYNYYKKGHFASECMAPRENMNIELVRRNVIVETIETKALVAQDELGSSSSDFELVVAGNQTNGNTGTKENIDAGLDGKKIVPDQKYILLPLVTSDPLLSKSSKDSPNAGFKPSGEEEKIDSEHQENEDSEVPNTEAPSINQEQDTNVNSTNNINTVSSTVNAADIENNDVDENIVYGCIDDPNMPNLEEIVYSGDDEEVSAEVSNKIRKSVRGIVDRNKAKNWLAQVYVDDIIFGSIKKSLCVEFEKMKHKRFQMSSMGELIFFLGLQVKQKDDGIFISQDKYVASILKKFDFATMKTASTPIETNKALLKYEEAEDVDVHLYRSMIRSLMYLTASRPDKMFAVCVCARFQVTPKTSHLHIMKKIFRYLKGHLKLGLWYPRDSPFDLEDFFDSNYAGVSLDRLSTTKGCQFLGRRLISWQCKKHTIVANFTTEVEYVAAANCYRQVLWIQNQLLDYRYNFMNTKIFINNESTICIVKNLVFHSKTKHIKIRHHFIRDSYEKRLIQVIKIHTDHNISDLLTKAFDVSRFQYLIARYLEWNGTAAKDEFQMRLSLRSRKTEWKGPPLLLLTQSMATLNESFLRINSGSGPRVNTLGSGEDNMKLKELMEFCTKLSVRALDL
ncbi:putative ribonuclease H-like domain-containing protein [Tanacetum coccineum]